jgi:hypothetical protein
MKIIHVLNEKKIEASRKNLSESIKNLGKIEETVI